MWLTFIASSAKNALKVSNLFLGSRRFARLGASNSPWAIGVEATWKWAEIMQRHDFHHATWKWKMLKILKSCHIMQQLSLTNLRSTEIPNAASVVSSSSGVFSDGDPDKSCGTAKSQNLKGEMLMSKDVQGRWKCWRFSNLKKHQE